MNKTVFIAVDYRKENWQNTLQLLQEDRTKSGYAISTAIPPQEFFEFVNNNGFFLKIKTISSIYKEEAVQVYWIWLSMFP